MNLDSEITEIKGVGVTSAEKYHKLGINTVRDFLFHIPYKYQDTSNVLTIKSFLENSKGTFLAEIVAVKTIYTRTRKQLTTVKVKDDTDTLSLTYFHQPYLSKTLKPGDIYLFNGQLAKQGNKRSIYNPKMEKFKGDVLQQTHLGKWIGVYSETKGLSSNTIRLKLKTLQEEIPNLIFDPLSAQVREKNNLESLSHALENVHFPKSHNDIVKGRERLAFDEMLNIAFRIETQALEHNKSKSKKIPIDTKLTNNFIKNLPYKLTNDQGSAIDQLLEEIGKTKPMNRLLNGDVGSGKTIVSAVAILNTIKAGYTAILIAPTTVLASQHYVTFKTLFKDLDIPIDLYISSKKIINTEKARLLIGTHALFYQKQLPKNVNLVVIDEQHRFGVEQRQFFKSRENFTPHYLTMTATPIPRSLTEVFFGDLDVSEIKEKPANRKEIKTYFTPYSKRDDCFSWIRKQIENSNFKEQALVIYPLIEESSKSNIKSVLNEFNFLKEKHFENLKIAYLHGRLKPKEKDSILEDFKSKKYNILVSTTVIEVGIDIPDLTMMVIENAERFGLAQLHQLRGRIGRNDMQSYCYVIPGQESTNEDDVKERLRYFASHPSGFDVADYDLQRRGPGEVYGTRQSGIPNFKVASVHDILTLKKARNVARKLLLEDNNYDKITENLFR